MNFMTKTEWVLSEQESVKAKLRAFANTSGNPGRNKPTGMLQTTISKLSKEYIALLCFNVWCGGRGKD